MYQPPPGTSSYLRRISGALSKTLSGAPPIEKPCIESGVVPAWMRGLSECLRVPCKTYSCVCASSAELKSIVGLEMAKVADRLLEKKVKLKVEDSALAFLADIG